MGASASFGGFGVTFSLTDAFSSVADTIQSKFTQLSTSTESMADRVNRGMNTIMTGAAQVGAGLALLTPVGLGVKFAGEFEAAEIGLRTLLGTEEAAHKAFEAIKADAASTPFGTADLLNANRGLISAGKSAEEARDTVLALGNAIAASGGGSVELNRMAANLQQIGTLGKATSVDIKQFGMAGINIYKLLADSTGKTVDQVKEMDVSYEVLSKALKDAAGSGGMFEGAMARMSKSINGKMSTIEDGVKFALAAVGESIMPIVHVLFDMIIKMTDAFAEFAKTGLGKTVIAVGVAIIAFLALTLIISGLGTVFSGLGTIIWSALAPLIPFLAIAALVSGIIVHMVGGVDNLMMMFKGLSAVFQSAGKDGFSMSQELATALDEIGLLDFVVAMGTWFVRIKEFFSGLIDGLMTVYNVVATVFGVIWDIITTVVEAAVEVMSWFGIEMTNQTSSLESWATAGEIIGYVLGVVLVMALLALLAPLYSVAVAFVAAFWFPMLIILLIVAVLWILWEVVSFVWDILKSVGAWIMDNFGPVIDGLVGAFKILGNIIKFIADALAFILKPILEAIGAIFGWLWDNCIKPLVDGIKWLWNTISEGAVSAFTTLDGFLTGLWEAISAPFVALGDFFSGLWDSIVTSFSNMLNWLGDAWDNSFLGKATSMLIDGAVNVAGTASDIATGATTFDSLVAPSNNTDGALNSLGGMNAQQAAGTAPVVNNTNSESVKSITIVQQIDSEEIAKKVIEKNEFDAARG